MSVGSRKLLTPERENLILSRLDGGCCGIAELSEALGVSEATIRRDLDSLESQGKLRRVHGGALRVKSAKVEPVFQEKEAYQEDEKKRVASMALELIDDGDTIYLDGGSTVLWLAKRLGEKRNLTVVTNSLMAAAQLMESPHKLILVGGEFRALSRTMVGPLTASVINALHVDKAFLGTIGFTVEDGLSTTDPNEAYTKELVMRRAAKVVALVDGSKLGLRSLAVSGSVSDIDVLVTDTKPSEKIERELRRKRIEVRY